MNEEQRAIACLKRGDLAGLEFLVERYQAQAVHAAYLIAGERTAAEDIVQAAFLKAADRIAQFDTRRPWKPWFLRIVTNDAIKYAQRCRRHLSLDEDNTTKAVAAWLVDPGPTPEELVEIEDLRQAVRHALQQLTPEQRAVVVLRHFLDMSEADMIQEIDRPITTIKWRLYVARQRLRELLKRFQGDHQPDEDCYPTTGIDEGS